MRPDKAFCKTLSKVKLRRKTGKIQPCLITLEATKGCEKLPQVLSMTVKFFEDCLGFQTLHSPANSVSVQTYRHSQVLNEQLRAQ